MHAGRRNLQRPAQGRGANRLIPDPPVTGGDHGAAPSGRAPVQRSSLTAPGTSGFVPSGEGLFSPGQLRAHAQYNIDICGPTVLHFEELKQAAVRPVPR